MKVRFALTTLTQLASTLVWVVVSALLICLGSKGRLKLCGVGPSVMQVFKLTRLASVSDIQPTRDEALTSF
jgi:anti-anti-sigma regulatory factor